MNAALIQEESLETGIHRILAEQIGTALTELSKEGGSFDEAVHEARKCLKRSRSVLRLVRQPIGAAGYSDLNARLREAGRLLSEVRDTQALLETFEDLTKDIGPFNRVFKLLQSRKEEATRAVQDSGRVPEAIAVLRQALNISEALPLDDLQFPRIRKAFEKSLKRGQRTFAEVQEEPTAENFHECRKRTKHLRYQLGLLSPLWSDVLNGYESSAKQIEQWLGEDHNLAVLAEIITNEKIPTPKKLTGEIVKRQETLRDKAQRLAGQFFAEPVSAWKRKLDASWKAWEQAGQLKAGKAGNSRPRAG